MTLHLSLDLSLTSRMAAAGASEERLWADEPAPGLPDVSDADPGISLGTVFSLAVAGTIVGAYIRVADTPPAGQCRLLLTDVSGVPALLANEVIPSIGPGGWTRFDFTSPVAVGTGAHMIYYHQLDSGGLRYTATAAYWTDDLVVGNVTGLSSANANALPDLSGNGSFIVSTDPTALPTSTFNSTNYWVDPIFRAAA